MNAQRQNGRERERGFALLLVFCMAAAVAISLYMELPRVAFETQRSREQLLVERGEEYKRAIQLYVRKFNKYPQNLDELEKSNNIRFLRKRFKDPLTGKDEWRLIHTNGAYLTDSLVEKPPDLNAKKEEPAAAATEPAQLAQMAQRRPSDRGVMPPPGFDQNAQQPNPNNPYPVNPGGPLPPGQMQPNQNGPMQMMPSGVPYPGQVQTMPSGVPYPGQVQTMPSGVPYPGQQPLPGQQPQPVGRQLQPGQPPQPGQLSPFPFAGQRPGVPLPIGIPQPQPGSMPGMMPQPPYPPQQVQQPQQPYPPQPYYPPQASPGPFPGQQNPQQGPQRPPTTGQNQAIDLIKNILTNPRPGGLQGLQQQSGNVGMTLGAGLAGVASTAEGEGIRVYNDRSKYKEWEFVYDRTKDRAGMGAAAGMGVQGQGQGQMGGQPQQQGTGSSFGGQGSSFGGQGSTLGGQPSVPGRGR